MNRLYLAVGVILGAALIGGACAEAPAAVPVVSAVDIPVASASATAAASTERAPKAEAKPYRKRARVCCAALQSSGMSRQPPENAYAQLAAALCNEQMDAVASPEDWERLREELRKMLMGGWLPAPCQ